MSRTLRVNLIMSGELEKQFRDALKKQRLQDLEEDKDITSNVEMARFLIEKGLGTRVQIPVGLVFKDKSIRYSEKRKRFDMTFYPGDVERLRAAGHFIQKGAKLNVSITQ